MVVHCETLAPEKLMERWVPRRNAVDMGRWSIMRLSEGKEIKQYPLQLGMCFLGDAACYAAIPLSQTGEKIFSMAID
jgi:hypothetical protein